MNLYEDHLLLDNGIQHRRVSQLHAQNKNPTYQETRVVQSETSGHAYILGKIGVLEVPFPEADVAADAVEVWVCSCDDFHFSQSDGVETGERAPSECGECKHITDEVKVERAKADEGQASLGGVLGDD